MCSYDIVINSVFKGQYSRNSTIEGNLNKYYLQKFFDLYVHHLFCKNAFDSSSVVYYIKLLL